MKTKKINLRIVLFTSLSILLFTVVYSINLKAKNCIYNKVVIEQTTAITASIDNTTKTVAILDCEHVVSVNPTEVTVHGQSYKKNEKNRLQLAVRIKKID